MTCFIDAHRERFGVAPICRALDWCASTYYAYKARPPSDRALRDADLAAEIYRVWTENYQVFGARKVWITLGREGIEAARCTVERLMADMGLAGVRRGPTPPTTTRRGPEPAAATPDLVERDFTADRPDQLWVADLTYVPVAGVFCYTALVSDAYSRLIVGWALAAHMRTELVLSALEMAIWRRSPASLDGLVHHSDKGCQYTSMGYTDRLSLERIAASVGSTGDSYDNALAEATIGLYKTELIHHHGPWHSRTDLELATLEYIDWFNHRRVHGACGDVPPAEYEAAYWTANPTPLAYPTGTQ